VLLFEALSAARARSCKLDVSGGSKAGR
jgi:hypothetical protein